MMFRITRLLIASVKEIFVCGILFFSIFFHTSSVYGAESDSLHLLNNPLQSLLQETVFNEQYQVPLTVQKSDVKKIISDPGQYFTTGNKHTFVASEHTTIALMIRIQGVVSFENVESALSGSSVNITTPDGFRFSSIGKHIMIFQASQEGEYVFEIESDEAYSYTLGIFELSSPFWNAVTFLGPQFDYSNNQRDLDEYIRNGGNAVIYNNAHLLETVDVEIGEDTVREPDGYKRGVFDRVFERYYSEGQSVTNIYTTETSRVLGSYKNITLAVEQSIGDGSVIILNPIIYTLDKDEVYFVLGNVIPAHFYSSDEGINALKAMSSPVAVINILLLGVLLLFFIRFVLLSQKKEKLGILSVSGKKQYLRMLCIGAITGGVVFIFSVLALRNELYIYIHGLRLTEAVYQLVYLLQVAGVYHHIVLFSLLVGLYMFIGSILFVMSLVKNFSFLTSEFSQRIQSGVSFMHRHRFRHMMNSATLISIFLLLAAVMVKISTLVYSYSTPVFFERREVVEDVLSGSVSDGNLRFMQNYNSLQIEYTPFFDGAIAETTFSMQHNELNDSIYITMNSKGKNPVRKLFFDKDIAHFPHKERVGPLYAYSSGGTADTFNDENSLSLALFRNPIVGVDLAGITFYSSDEDKKLNLNKYLVSPDAKFERNVEYDLQLSGKLVFYTVLGGDLYLDLLFDDTNQHVGRDDFSIKVLNQDNEVVASTVVPDDNVPVLQSISCDQSVTLQEEGLPLGVYKILLNSSEVRTDQLLDIIFKKITVNSDKFVLSSIDQSIVLVRGNTSLYYYPFESSFITQNVIPTYNFVASDNDRKTETFSDTIARMQTHQNIVCDNCTLLSEYNFYAFSQESYFYPFTFYVTEVSEIDDFVLSVSDLTISKDGQNWYNTTLQIEDESYTFGEPVSWIIQSSETNHGKFTIEKLELQFNNTF